MTLLIKNVRILGGAQSFYSRFGLSRENITESEKLFDVFINRDRISAIGNFPNKRAATVLDGMGAYLSPGFIDVNTSSDHYFTLFDYPSQDDFLKQGVTTIMGGMRGSSLAPLLYGSLESIQKWTNDKNLNVNWHTVAEFLKAIDRRALGVNFGTMAGYGTIRRAITGNSLRSLTKNEVSVFSGLLEKAMQEGAFGLSTEIDHVHTKKIAYPEIKSLANITHNTHGVYAVSPSDFVPLSDSIIEATRLLKEFDISILANHFVPTKNKSVEYEKALMAIENLSDEANFHFDVCPFSTTLMPLHSFLPLWIQKDGQDSILPNIKDEWMFPRIVKDMPLIDEDNFVVAHAPGNDFLVGRTLRDIKEMYEVKDAREALLHFMVAMELRGAAFYKNIDEDLLRKAILSKRSLIASDAPSFDAAKRGIQLKSERTTDTFLKFLSLVEKEGIMPLDAAIRKITQIPAQKFGLSGRGEIKEGNFADLVCFRDANVKFTVVNGRVAVKDGAFQNIFAGHALRHI